MSTAAHPPLVGQHATIGDAMDAAVAQFGDREAYVDGARRITFAEWIAAADGLAAELTARGLARARAMSWTASARRLRSVYRAVTGA